MDYYCTLMDHRYARQGLALIRSLRSNGGNEPVWVLCLSEEAVDIVDKFDADDVRSVSIKTIESYFPDLLEARGNRSLIEYYFTLKPFMIRYIFDHAADANRVAYLDSDLFFFGNLGELWRAFGGAPVAITPHNFSRRSAHLIRNGIYNAGFAGFSRSEQGLRCLDFWLNSCRERCVDTPGEGGPGDQGYLNYFHEYAPDLAIIKHKGCNLGPWNVGGYNIGLNGSEVTVDENKLIFFHFTGFKKDMADRWYNSHRFYRTGTTKIVRDHIYRPYLTALLSAGEYVQSLLPPNAQAPTKLARNRDRGLTFKQRILPFVQKTFHVIDLVTGKAIKESSAYEFRR